VRFHIHTYTYAYTFTHTYIHALAYRHIHMHVLLLLFDSIKWHTHYLSESKWEKGRLSEFMVVREVRQDAVWNACNVAKLDVSTL